MPNQATQLLRADKGLEARIEHFAFDRLVNDWLCSHPRYVLCLRKQLPHQLVLAAQHDIDDTITNSILADGSEVEGIDAGVGVGGREEFNEAVHCLSRGTVHDDVDGRTKISGNDLGVRTKKVQEGGFSKVVGNL